MAFTPPGATAGSGTSPTLRDVFSIPEHSGTSTFVLQLSDAVTRDELGTTLAEYVVTPSIGDAFDEALALVDSALASGENKGAFLKGSFGSGKSHFMAVLLALLTGDPRARAIAELQQHIADHPRATSSKILALPFHFLGSNSIEDTLFSAYLEHLNRLHPGVTPP
ncbi:phage resistance protein, partial [Dietzia sp. SLG510A3-40A3]|nr:phage resistance protein [Dietzia sp. SLG510A3-40A3]